MIAIANAFSIQMLDGMSGNVTFTRCKVEQTCDMVRVYDGEDGNPDHQIEYYVGPFESYVGHQDTANVLCLPCNRAFFKFDDEHRTLLVAQLMGGRLPEGCTTLPDNMRIEWYLCRLTNSDLDL